MRSKLLETLITIESHKAPTTTSVIAVNLGVSQQTASRQIIELEQEGLIERRRIGRKQSMVLTAKGLEKLRETHARLRLVFENQKKVVIKGVLVSGSGEGSYYMSIPYYVDKFRDCLGFKPYPGTLNLKLDEENTGIKKRLTLKESITVKGFESEKRSFGEVKCFPSEINGVKVTVILPERTHHEFNILEVISKECLRRKLGLKNGDTVSMEIH